MSADLADHDGLNFGEGGGLLPCAVDDASLKLHLAEEGEVGDLSILGTLLVLEIGLDVVDQVSAGEKTAQTQGQKTPTLSGVLSVDVSAEGSALTEWDGR